MMRAPIMGEVVRLYPSSTEGVDLTVMILRAVQNARGTEAAMSLATEMIVAASTVMAREAGPVRALAVLANAAAVLPTQPRC